MAGPFIVKTVSHLVEELCHGELNDGLRQWLPHVTSGITFTHHPTHWGGFTRLGATSESA